MTSTESCCVCADASPLPSLLCVLWEPLVGRVRNPLPSAMDKSTGGKDTISGDVADMESGTQGCRGHGPCWRGYLRLQSKKRRAFDPTASKSAVSSLNNTYQAQGGMLHEPMTSWEFEITSSTERNIMKALEVLECAKKTQPMPWISDQLD